MASARVEGIYRITIRSPSGNQVKVFESRSEYVGHGGSSDGAIANSPEKWVSVPVSRSPSPSGFFKGGDELIVSIIPDAGATLDISDARFIIPITDASGNLLNLANNTTDMNGYLVGDTAIVAAQETVVAKHRAPEGRRWVFGGGKMFMSIENNS